MSDKSKIITIQVITDVKKNYSEVVKKQTFEILKLKFELIKLHINLIEEESFGNQFHIILDFVPN